MNDSNFQVVVGKGMIESALRKQPGFEIQTLRFIPPDSVRAGVKISQVLLNRTFVLFPTATIQPSVVNGSLRFEVRAVSLFGIPFPPGLVEQQVRDLARAPEQEANELIQEVVEKTGLNLKQVSLTEDGVVLSFGIEG